MPCEPGEAAFGTLEGGLRSQQESRDLPAHKGSVILHSFVLPELGTVSAVRIQARVNSGTSLHWDPTEIYPSSNDPFLQPGWRLPLSRERSRGGPGLRLAPESPLTVNARWLLHLEWNQELPTPVQRAWRGAILQTSGEAAG